MHYIVSVYVVQSTQKLVCVQLDEHRVHLLTQTQEVLLDAEDIRWHVVHNNV